MSEKLISKIEIDTSSILTILTSHISHLKCLVMMAEGTHAYPYRTQPLSPPAPMVLGPQGPGRVGRCQAIKKLGVRSRI